MRRARSLVSLLVLALIYDPALAQLPASEQMSVRVRRFEVGGSSADTMMESALDIAFAINNQLPEKAIVRLCSKRPMRIAIATAAANPVYFARSMFYHRSLPLERIIVSRSEDCLGKFGTTAATELWAVANGGTLPPAVESVKSCQIKLQYIESGFKKPVNVPFRRTYDHNKSIERLISELRNNPQATGIVIGYYLKNPKKILKIKLQEAKRMLARSGLSPDRYFLQLMTWPGFPEGPEPKYLSVAIADIMPGCLQLPREDEIIIAQ